MTKPVASRKLHSGHFAFMRALAQGLDQRASWDRYLGMEGEHSDVRAVRRTVAWIRDEFAAAAIRMNRPGTARLILLDPERFASAAVLPSLQEFAEANGMEDFSEAEQVDAYEQAFPESVRRAGRGSAGTNSRRGRVIERQLEALRWLQTMVAQDPKPGDSVDAWLNPSHAHRVRRAGVTTLEGLVQWINGIGARWWVQLPGVGPVKAARIQEWLHANEEVLGLKVGAHVAQPIRKLSRETLALVVPAATALRPFEMFIVPAELDGRAGRYRASSALCQLTALNDYQAVQGWLAAKRSHDALAGAQSATQRAYRKEAERLLLWAVLERRAALSSLSAADVEAYAAFLAAPPASWCGPRHHQRWSALWRPLEGPLRPPALRRALTILRGLFGYLVEHGYVTRNPFAGLAMLAPMAMGSVTGRALSFAHWDHVDALLQSDANTLSGRRLRRAIRWIYATGLRLAEITGLKCEDIAPANICSDVGTLDSQWFVTVRGTGGHLRQVGVPAYLVSEFGDELARHGFDRQVNASRNEGIYLLARFDSHNARPTPWSASGLYQAIKAFFAKAATDLGPAERAELSMASTHWIRHTHGVHALRGRDGQGPLPLEVVQNNVGHASPRTTAKYLAQPCRWQSAPVHPDAESAALTPSTAFAHAGVMREHAGE